MAAKKSTDVLLRESVAKYISLKSLREWATGAQPMPELGTDAPQELHDLLAAMAALFKPETRYQIGSPRDVAAYLMAEMSILEQEHLRVVCLDIKHRVQKVHTVYIGSVNSVTIRPGEVFREAVKLTSAAIIIVHNHPSGDPTPSPEDSIVTRQIIEAGKLLTIAVLDHLIIGHGRFVSMNERGLADFT